MSLEANLLRLREKKGLSADALGKKIGVSKQAIYQYEQGKSVPGKDKLALLAEAFGVTVAQLYQDSIDENLTSVKNPEDQAKGNAIEDRVLAAKDETIKAQKQTITLLESRVRDLENQLASQREQK